jgi:hypothetical protein
MQTAKFRAEIEAVLGTKIFQLPKDQALMQAAVETMDARAERDRMKLLLEAVRGEIRTLAALQMRQRGTNRLVLTQKELNELGEFEVHVETPEPGIRIYELRAKHSEPEKSKIVGVN